MAGRGRPKKEDARRGQYRLGMSGEDAKMPDYIAKKSGKSKAEILREGLRVIYESSKIFRVISDHFAFKNWAKTGRSDKKLGKTPFWSAYFNQAAPPNNLFLTSFCPVCPPFDHFF